MSDLVLSLFPGIGLLDLAFEEQGFCVVRGPDLLWGGDIKKFHPPQGRFDGVIGGPPCQAFSSLVHIIRHRYAESAVADNLIPEFQRCVTEARPAWFLMENVPQAPVPSVDGYSIKDFLLNNRWLGEEQERHRRFSFGILNAPAVDLRRYIDFAPLESYAWAPAVLASGKTAIRDKHEFVARDQRLKRMGYKTKASLAESLRLQGLPADHLDHAPFTIEGKIKVVGNGVPLAMGRAIARAVDIAADPPCVPVSLSSEEYL